MPKGKGTPSVSGIDVGQTFSSDEEHPDYVAGRMVDERVAAAYDTEAEVDVDTTAFVEYDQEEGNGSAVEGDIAFPIGRPELPYRPPRIRPGPQIPVPIRICSAVSGRYRYAPPFQLRPRPFPRQPLPRPESGPFPQSPLDNDRPVVPRRIPGRIIPINTLRINVRVDVDRFFPQNRISIEVSRLFPRSTTHIIANVTSDVCSGINHRTVKADVVYRDGSASLLPGSKVEFRARRGRGFAYGKYELVMYDPGQRKRKYNLTFESRYFDPVVFEVDRVDNAGSIVTSYDTGSHPTRPTDLPSETLSLESVFERTGFDVQMSPGTTTIPVGDAGANGTWSDAEMHNAMVTYWSHFANRPQWSMWILYAGQHDLGHGLGGIMFDDIGPQHRQGTAIFTDSFIQDVPTGDPDPTAWRNRMQFWTAVHEMGHAFNLAHSWQKALGRPAAPGDPWIPLANDPEARSFMNYPFRVSGGESAFFSDFRFRFTDEELQFMRHAPRRFVQMGNSDWFDNHGFEAPSALQLTGNWELKIRPNRSSNGYQFLEPVVMELKLTNTSGESTSLDKDMLQDGSHITVFLQREGGETKQWRPLMTRCHESHDDALAHGESIYGSHVISTSTNGWLIDEPGFYKLQAAIDLTTEIVVSNVLRIYVGPPASREEVAIAPDYFSEEVGRVLTFQGAPVLSEATDVLRTVAETCPDNPAARHARVATEAPGLRRFKNLNLKDGARDSMELVSSKPTVESSADALREALLDEPDAAADTIGHISYFSTLRTLAEALEDSGDTDQAVDLMSTTIDVMKQRDILKSVIYNAERRLKNRKDRS